MRTAEREQAEVPDHLNDQDRRELLFEWFAALFHQCRIADLGEADRQASRIAELAGRHSPELGDLAFALVAQARGDIRGAERLLSACLRRPHRFESVTRPVALINRATLRMLLGLLDAGLTDLAEAEEYGPSLLSIQGLGVEALIHWWRGDRVHAVEALERAPQLLVEGLDLGVAWYALAAESVHNGQPFEEALSSHNDCMARDFWDARSSHQAPTYVAVLGPHMVRHELAFGNNPRPLLDQLRLNVPPESTAGRSVEWCGALVDEDADHLAELADRYRDSGALLFAIEAYRDAAQYAPTVEAQERLSRRGRLIHERLSRAIKVKSPPELPAAIAQVLTDAEQSVVAVVAEGLNNREAADTLGCSVRTVDAHLASAYGKLGIKRPTQLAVLIAQAKMDT